jgi:hypothetical protein
MTTYELCMTYLYDVLMTFFYTHHWPLLNPDVYKMNYLSF